jgi:S-ribosylhomocysteine lyase LuxS involved in autoinducer biosynthesis
MSQGEILPICLVRGSPATPIRRTCASSSAATVYVSKKFDVLHYRIGRRVAVPFNLACAMSCTALRPHRFAAAVRAAGGKVDVINLPDLGIKGNSHMVMMDKNNDAVAVAIQKWLMDQGLTFEEPRKRDRRVDDYRP